MTPEQLRAARESLALTQTDVATALGVDLRTYQRWESGEAPVPRWVSRRAATMVHRLLDEGT